MDIYGTLGSRAGQSIGNILESLNQQAERKAMRRQQMSEIQELLSNPEFVSSLQQAQAPQISQPDVVMAEKKTPRVFSEKRARDVVNEITSKPAMAQGAPDQVSNKMSAAEKKLSAKQSETITKKIDSARELLQIADEMEKLVKTGKVAYGTKGAWAKRLNNWGGIALGDETGTFDSLGSQAAILEAALIPGVTTNEKLKAAERTKPNITQSRKTQQARIKAMRKKAQDIIDQYGGLVMQEPPFNAAEFPGKKFTKNGITVESVNDNGTWTWRAI